MYMNSIRVEKPLKLLITKQVNIFINKTDIVLCYNLQYLLTVKGYLYLPMRLIGWQIKSKDLIVYLLQGIRPPPNLPPPL